MPFSLFLKDFNATKATVAAHGKLITALQTENHAQALELVTVKLQMKGVQGCLGMLIDAHIADKEKVVAQEREITSEKRSSFQLPVSRVL